ncbi:MAG TPA: hypothetical protein VGB83_04335 [Actinomycetota bacterium]
MKTTRAITKSLIAVLCVAAFGLAPMSAQAGCRIPSQTTALLHPLGLPLPPVDDCSDANVLISQGDLVGGDVVVARSHNVYLQNLDATAYYVLVYEPCEEPPCPIKHNTGTITPYSSALFAKAIRVVGGWEDGVTYPYKLFNSSSEELAEGSITVPEPV